MKKIQKVVQKRSEVTPRKTPVINARRCPLLQDINGDMAYILSHSTNSSSEETMVELSNVATLTNLQEARSVAFVHALGYIDECDDTRSTTATKYKLKQRRGVKAKASLALDIVNLFNFLCGSHKDFPMDVLASDRLTRAHVAPRDPKDIHCPLLASTNDTSCPLDDSVSHDVTSSPRTYLVPRCAVPARAPHYFPPHALARRTYLQCWLVTSLAHWVRQSTLGLPSHPCPSISKTIQPIPIITPRAAVTTDGLL